MNPDLFNVKEESLFAFFKKYSTIDAREFDRSQSVYYFFKDVIYLKKSIRDDVQGDTITFTLCDRGAAGRDLVNTYIYSIRYYDDVSAKLELIDFKVSLK